MEGIIRAWGRILAGYQPNLSIEITRECPLTCPGCYAYGSDHLGGGVTLRELQDFKGQQLVDAMFALLDKYKPLHVSIVGGEPLVRFRELSEILPRMADMGIYTQLVTSAVRPIPIEWADLRRLQLVVSIDGLQPEHDERRKPATYDRILKHIEGHDIRVHCTVTRQQIRREGLPGGVREVLVGEPRRLADLDEPVHAAGRRDLSRAPHQGGPGKSGGRPARDPVEIPEAARAEGAAGVLRAAAALSRRLHLRQDDGLRVVELSRSRSRRASSAATRTARTAAASPRRRWPPSADTSCPAVSGSARSLTRRFASGRECALREKRFARVDSRQSSVISRRRQSSRVVVSVGSQSRHKAASCRLALTVVTETD